ncbi:MAG: hypothetical protein KQH63_10150 [Desulfobulbaceae bacterium]|nr:hypothetical protein [Desulfobulbaceae bacterium]
MNFSQSAKSTTHSCPFRHDCNNLLTVILGNIAIAEKQASPSKEITDRLADARDATYKIIDLLKAI